MAAPSKQPEPRRHHYVPRCWLAGFTDTGDQDGTLWVTDLGQRKQWDANPGSTGFINDFYRISEEDLDPVTVEKALAEMEGEVAPILKAMDRERCPPDKEDFGKLLFFMAIQWARVPAFRSMIFKVLDDVAREKLAIDLKSKESWLKTLEAAGFSEDSPGASYESMLEFYNSGEFSLKVQTEWYIQQTFKSAHHIFPTLAGRRWRMTCSPGGGFIGSDNPVTLDGLKGKEIGFKNADIIAYPVSKYVVLYSTLKPTPPPLDNRKNTAGMNTFCLMRAEQVFSSAPDFCWSDEWSKVQTDWTLFSRDKY
jgi:hypothetical protein